MKLLCLSTSVFSLLFIQSALCTDTSASTSKDRQSTSSTAKRKVGRPRGSLAIDDMDYSSIRHLPDLISHRPSRTLKNASTRFRKAFADHDQIRAIDLTQAESRLAQDFHRLRIPQASPDWHKKMTLAMKDYLNEAEGISKQRVKEVLGYNHAQNQMRHDANRKRKMLQEGDTSRERKNKRAREYHVLHGKERKATAEMRNQFFHMLDVLGSEVERPTAGQVAKKAEALRYMYPQERRYWAALKSYLQLKRYPADEIMMIMGVRAKDRAKYRDKISDAKRREVEQSLSSRTDPKSHGSQSQQPEMEASSSKAKGKRPLGEATEKHSPKRMKTEDGQHSQPYNRGDSDTESSSSSHAKVPSGATIPMSERSTSSSDGAKGSTLDTLEPGAWWEDGYFDN